MIQMKAGIKKIIDSLYSVKILIKWLVLGTFIGFLVGSVCSIFGHMLVWANDYRLDHQWISILLPFGGLLIVFMYRVWNNEDDKGTNQYRYIVDSFFYGNSYQNGTAHLCIHDDNTFSWRFCRKRRRCNPAWW